MGDIPSLGRLTVYMGDAGNLNAGLLQDFINAVTDGHIQLNIDKTFSLGQVAEAHVYMEGYEARGKIVLEM